MSLVTIKLANDLLILIYDEYKKENGEGIARLKFARFRVDDPKFVSFVTAKSDIDDDKDVRFLLSNLLLELHERGFILKKNMQFTIEPKGVNKVLQLQNPVMYFVVNNTKWCIATVLAFITVIIALLK